MTFERPDEVRNMIDKLQAQSVPPEKILVVDNSSSFETKLLIDGLANLAVEYYRVGFNSGPAGAAYFGLQILAGQGYEWISWIDDNDPPTDVDDYRNLFEVLNRATLIHQKIGIVGKVAGRFGRLTGRTLSFRNFELKDDIMEADFVPGNTVSLINGKMIRSGVLPTTKLFFGFEELDFCLKVGRAGYKILFDAGAFLRNRRATGRGHPQYKYKGQSIGVPKMLWRQYYSVRNMLWTLASNNLWIALIFNLLRSVVKSFYGLRYGFKYGTQNFGVQWLAITHFLLGKYGKRDLSRLLGPR